MIQSDLSSKPAFDQTRFLHKVSAMIVDEFVLEKAVVNGLIDNVMTVKNSRTLFILKMLMMMGGIINHSSKMGKKNRDHEMINNPPPYAPIVNHTKEQPDKAISKNIKDDIYSYNTALMNEGLYNVDKEIRKKSRGSYHSHSSTKDDVYEILHKLMEKDALTPCENREYRSFPKFERDSTSRFDSLKLFKWVNKHKKNIDLGTKTR